jgi:hypothetical protein
VLSPWPQQTILLSSGKLNMLLLSSECIQKITLYDRLGWKQTRQTSFKVPIFVSDVTVLITKHNELSFGVIYSMCVFQFKLSICRPRNLLLFPLFYHSLY